MRRSYFSRLPKHFVAFAVLLTTPALTHTPISAQTPPPATRYLVYVGTYTDGTSSKGIYAYRFDSATGKVEDLGLAAASQQPSFLTVDAAGKYLYAVNELDTFESQPTGAISSFAI